jgi:S1-C subfamily serine protease
MNMLSRIAAGLIMNAMAVGLFPASVAANRDIFSYLLNSAVFIDSGRSTGSGVLVDLPNRLVATAYHVVDDVEEVRIFFSVYDANGELVTDKSTYLAEENSHEFRACGAFAVGRVVAVSKEKDLALVQLDQLPCEAQAVPLADTCCEIGDNVHIVGNPEMGMWVYTPGRVRRVAKMQTLIGRDQLLDAFIMMTSCPSNPGDSGGPVVNDDGELVGIHSHHDGSQRLAAGEIDGREVRMLLEWYLGDRYDRELATSEFMQP